MICNNLKKTLTSATKIARVQQNTTSKVFESTVAPRTSIPNNGTSVAFDPIPSLTNNIRATSEKVVIAPSVDNTPKRKTLMLRELLTPKPVVIDAEAAKQLPFNLQPPTSARKLEFIMEAHNGLSAKIVQKAGFKGIWASGLSISAALGVRDNNEASWTQILEVLEFMSDNTDIPILVDGDTGYGNFNNARRLVRKLEQRQIAGVCIEDKIFPKTNSFLGDNQPLADIDEFCGKIKAMKDQQSDPYFNVIARTEAFIAGHSVGEALKRAEAYRKAGADAILLHSKRADSSELDIFMKEWANRHPVVIVPTKYYAVPTQHFSDIGVNMVIWANHNLRSCITAMERVCERIMQDQSLINVEKAIASVNHVFNLQNADELAEAEKKYLPSPNQTN